MRMITSRMTKLSYMLLTSALFVLSSIAAAQLLSTNNNNVAFAAVKCEVTETDGILEEECTGGEGGIFIPDPDDERGVIFGGGGGHSICTVDLSTGSQDCTFSGGGASTSHVEGEGDPTVQATGGRQRCTFDPSTGEDGCLGHGVDVTIPPGEEEEEG